MSDPGASECEHDPVTALPARHPAHELDLATGRDGGSGDPGREAHEPATARSPPDLPDDDDHGRPSVVDQTRGARAHHCKVASAGPCAIIYCPVARSHPTAAPEGSIRDVGSETVTHHEKALHARLGRERGQSLAEFALVIPLLFLVAVAIGDFGRLYTAMIAVESAAREAADYGAFLGSDQWPSAGAPWTANDAEMRRRACAATSQLADFDDTAGTCSGNPVVTWELWETDNATKRPHHVIDPLNGDECAGRIGLVDPCMVHVTVTFDFHPFFALPPIPGTLTIRREAWFAISDLAVSGP